MALLIYNVILLAIQASTGAHTPPAPGGGNSTEGSQLPIDDYLWIILILGLCYGIYIAYKKSRAINNPS